VKKSVSSFSAARIRHQPVANRFPSQALIAVADRMQRSIERRAPKIQEFVGLQEIGHEIATLSDLSQ
jgi:hypothetical protein